MGRRGIGGRAWQVERGKHGGMGAKMARDGLFEEVTFGKPLEDFKYGNVMIRFMLQEDRSLAAIQKMYCSRVRGHKSGNK